ncbi:hypothetical protein ABBQ38_008878 [Trebouxia sp. C0009 RCD-2024]
MKAARNKAAIRLHDRVNLIALPVVGVLSVAGLLGYYDQGKVTNMMLSYIVADLLWIWLEPGCLPSMPGTIMVHHAVTILLLLFPLRVEGLHHLTCWDTIVEINTFFLIARRQLPSCRRLMHWAFWISFFPLRMVLYPYLVVHIYYVLAQLPWYERFTAVACQIILCGFNCMMLTASLQRMFSSDRTRAFSMLQGFCTGDLSFVKDQKKDVYITADTTAKSC